MPLRASLILSMSSRPSGRVRYCADEVAIVREPLHLSPYVIAVNEQGSHRSHDIATQIIVRVAKMLRKAGGLDRAHTQASPVSDTRDPFICNSRIKTGSHATTADPGPGQINAP